MQPPTAGPRAEHAAEDVVALLRDTPGVVFGHGCELIDRSLLLLEDFSADFQGGSVSRSAYATLHGTAQLQIARELAWGAALIRPYMTVTDGPTTMRFYLGAYFTHTPRTAPEQFPIVYAVDCYDILAALDDPVGDAYAVAAGASYLGQIEQILLSRGVLAYHIDQSARTATLPTDRTWPFDDRTTWLTIVNDLLQAIGYAGIWSDWDGRLRCEPYQTPRERAEEWTYDTDPDTSMLSTNRVVTQELTKAPNRWVFYQQNRTDGAPPVDGDGRYEYINQFSGQTSVEARGGRTVSRVVGLDVADHAALEASAQRTIDADIQVATHIDAETAPNPLHWHFDVLRMDDPAVGPPAKVLGKSWTLPLNGDDMTHEWSVVG